MRTRKVEPKDDAATPTAVEAKKYKKDNKNAPKEEARAVASLSKETALARAEAEKAAFVKADEGSDKKKMRKKQKRRYEKERGRCPQAAGS